MLANIPLGHVIPSHVVLGWCSTCPGRTAAEEAAAWRLWSMTHVPEVREALDSRDAKH